MSSSNSRVKERIRNALRQQTGGNGLIGLLSIFKQFDSNGTGYLSWDGFCSALQDIRVLFLELDKDANNEISYKDFVDIMRGEVSQNKKILINTIFTTIDKDGDGIISMTDIGQVFNPKNHPDCKNGKMSVNNYTNNFFEIFGTITETGYIRLQQFVEFYINLSAFDDELKFIEEMKSIWLSNDISINNDLLIPANRNYGLSSMSNLLQNTNYNLDYSTSSNTRNNSSTKINTFGSSSVGNLMNITSEADSAVLRNLNNLKEQLFKRGARGIVGLQRTFRIMDDDGSKQLNLIEFKKGIRDCDIKLTDLQLHQLFDYFDTNKNGSVDFDEFIVGIRGELNTRRRDLVIQAFKVLDKNGSGEVDPEDLIGVYSASKHPDVLAGKKTENEVLREFLDTFDVGGVKDGKVVLEEFVNYYSNLSASIDDDDYFELMIRNAWHLSGGEGQAANSANRRVLVTRADGSEYVEEIKNDLGLKAGDKAGIMERLKSQGSEASSVSLYGQLNNNNKSHQKVSTLSSNMARLKLNQSNSLSDNSSVKIAEAGPRTSKPSDSSRNGLSNIGTITASSQSFPNPGILYIIQKVKKEMESRGGKGFINMQRKFRIMDDDGSKSLSMAEFKKGMKEMNIDLSDSESRSLFDYFDTDHNGSINFEEFIQGVRDPLTPRRLRLVTIAFSKLDKDGSGIVDAEEVASLYDASKHPEVISGRKHPKEILSEFLDTFDVGGVHDGKVTLEEFVNYYTNIGANIDNEDYFELMIRNAWHLSGGEGQAANSANRRVLVTRADGSEYVEEIKNDLGLKAGDKAGIMERLKTQNVFASQVSLADSIESKRRPTSSSAPKSVVNKQFIPTPAQSREEVIAAVGPVVKIQSSVSVSKKNPSANNMNPGLLLLLGKIKSEMKARGAHGFIGLQRKFRIIDDDGSKQLTLSEFKKGMKETNLNLNDADLRLLFDYFDTDRSGVISFEEFIQGLRDPLTDRRLQLVKIAFSKLDKDGSGIVDAEEISSLYDASKHPDVIAGRRSESDILSEFLDTFDVGGVHDGKVTLEEFVNYYTNIGANIDNEDYFELMIRNAWHISGGEGQAANSANRRVLVTRADGSEYVEEIKNDLGLKAGDKAGIMDRLKAQNVFASSFSLSDSVKNEDNTFKRRFSNAHVKTTAPLGIFPGKMPPTKEIVQTKLKRDGKSILKAANVGVRMLIDKFKSEISVRGVHGFIGLQRKFRIMDDDGSKTLSMNEFKKGLKEMNINLNDSETRILFDHFDTDSSGTIDFEEFIQGVRDPLSDRRLHLVKLAFSVLDVDGSGIVDVEEIATKYDASKHPEVISGRKHPKEILSEFLDTFDVGGVHDGKVTLEEFVNYYTNIGANIDNEDYFELMIRNAWHLSGGEGQAANSANRRVLVTRADGSEYVEEIKNDLGLKAGDKAGALSRLKLDSKSSSLSFFGSANNTESPKKKSVNLGQLSRVSYNDNKVDSSKSKPPSVDSPSRLGKKSVSGATYGVSIVIAKIKKEIANRGARGFVGLQRKFRIMDDDGDKSLSLSEFKKGLKEVNIDIADSECRIVFDYFDTDSSGTINFEEFIQGLRDPLTDRRLQLVKQAFSKLDKDGSGIVDAEEVASLYDASKHPDVIAGRRKPKEILSEFLDTFDVGGVHDGKVTLEEFVNYYTNIGANIDNEDYFELMIRNAWHLSGGEGQAANSANRRVLVTRADGSEYVEEIKNDLGLKAGDKAGIMERLKTQNVFASQINIFGSDVQTERPKTAPPTSLSGMLKKPQTSNSNSNDISKHGKNSVSSLKSYTADPKGKEVGKLKAILSDLKIQLCQRGAKGIVGLQRKFKIMDDNGNGTLNFYEFKKSMKDCSLRLTDEDLQLLFNFFDTDKNGGIDFEEFMQGVKGPMSARRKNLVDMAFNVLDKNGNGLVEPDDIINTYDASKHPEVLKGNKTAAEALQEFLDTFDVGGVHDGVVTREEFHNYYSNVGASIDNEDYFELMIRNAWHISGGEGQAANSANRRVLVTRADGSEYVEEIKNDLGLKAGDKAGMMERLKTQNVFASQVNIFGSSDDSTSKNNNYKSGKRMNQSFKSQITIG